MDEQLNELDSLLLKARLSINLNHLDFNNNGYPIVETLNQDLIKKILDKITELCPKMLYRYRSGNDYNFEELNADQLVISTLMQFNDPFEDKVYIDYEAVAEDLLKNDNRLRGLSKNLIRNHPTYINYVEDLRKIGDRVNKDLEMKRGRLFCACFSEVNKSLLMWAHYANNHKGFCVGYNSNELIKMYGANLLPIIYSNDFLTINTYSVLNNHHEIFIKAAKTKSLDWSYEKEWRLFGKYIKNEPYNERLLIKAPIPSCIYLGVNISNKSKARLMDICDHKKIDLYQMQTSNKGYKLLSYKSSNHST